MKTFPKLGVVCLATLVMAPSALAQAPPLQNEFQVNTSTQYNQFPHGVSIDETGRFIVTWSDVSPFGAAVAYGRRFDAQGAPAGGEFQIDPPVTPGPTPGPTPVPTPAQRGPDVAKDALGRFVAVWKEGDNTLFARRFDASGAPLGNTFAVNVVTLLSVSDPTIASDASGNFVVAWTRLHPTAAHDVAARAFDSAGAPITGEFVVNAYTTGNQHAGGVAKSASGFVVAFGGEGPAGDGVFARAFDSAGSPATGDVPVNTGLVYFPVTFPDVAADASGDFVVAWTGTTPGGFGGIFVRRFDASAAPLGGEFMVNTITTGFQIHPRVAVDRSGNFIVAWQGGPDSGADPGEITARRYDRFGAATDTPEFAVSLAASYQREPHAAINDAGTFVVTWRRWEGYGAGYETFGRRSGARAAPEIVVDPLFNLRAPAAAAENGVLEPGESVLVLTAWTNQTLSDFAMAGTATDFDGPPGPTYTLDDATASYGVVPHGTTRSCFVTFDCFSVTVSAPAVRPVPHWDTLLQERHSTGAPKTWTLHVGESFADTGTSNLFYRSVETILHNGITGGCAGGGYCPTNPVTRAQMAVFLLKSKLGAAHVPPPATGAVFADVPISNPFAPWIEELAGLAITGGCGGGNYCPDAAVTRQQMAVFLLKTLEGSSYGPPDCTGVFADVPCTPDAGFADWIEELYDRQITGGCNATPLRYCPINPNNRGQMAVFLTKTFGLVLY